MIKTTAAIYAFVLCFTFFLYVISTYDIIPPYMIYNAVCILFLSFAVLCSVSKTQ